MLSNLLLGRNLIQSLAHVVGERSFKVEVVEDP
jgi:hypothetical protein